MFSPIFFTNFYHKFFSVWAVEKENFLFVQTSFFSPFGSWNRNHNKYLLKNSEFEIGENIWWIRYRSGDLGKLDEDQFLWMCGRLKELIITAGGENIAPLPIENNIVAELSDILSYVIGEISNE